MCSDVVVYPYQIYQARLAGADALKLIAPALPAKVGIATGYGTLATPAWAASPPCCCCCCCEDVKETQLVGGRDWVLQKRVVKVESYFEFFFLEHQEEIVRVLRLCLALTCQTSRIGCKMNRGHSRDLA